MICTILSIILALLAAYFGGASDWIISRFFDLIWAFPVILLGIALGTALSIDGFHHRAHQHPRRQPLDPDLRDRVRLHPVHRETAAWPDPSLRNREFVEASTSQGAGSLRIMFTELLPNIASTVLVLFTLIVANTILTEVGLSFLGAGVQPPNPSVGDDDRRRPELLASDPWLGPAAGDRDQLTVVSLNVFGDGFRDALDPRAKVRIEH